MQVYLKKGIYPFHMPGHKRNPMFLPQGLANLDLTEIPGMDVLSNPTGIIQDLQEAIADYYGADASFLLVNGSSAGIIASICAVCNKTRKLYAPRNGHISMYKGMMLSDVSLPTYILPEITADGLVGGIKPDTLDNIDEGAIVLVVSPTYEGFVSDIKEIAKIVHKKNGILIVDEAHGAHFCFHDAFPVSALELGADIVVQSFHKTLPALGQMAVLHVKSNRVDKTMLKMFLQTMQTTSPSYMLMGQLDYMLKMLWNRPEIFEKYIERLKRLRMALTSGDKTAINLTGTENVGKHGIFDIDIGKLLFRINTNKDAKEIAKILSEQYLIEFEMSIGKYVLAMTSVADTDEGFWRLWGAIGSYSIKLESDLCDLKQETGYHTIPNVIPKMAMTPRQTLNHKTETISWEKAPGRIAAETIAMYPPGIALVAPGEIIPEGLPEIAQYVQVIK